MSPQMIYVNLNGFPAKYPVVTMTEQGATGEGVDYNDISMYIARQAAKTGITKITLMGNKKLAEKLIPQIKRLNDILEIEVIE